MRHSNTTFRLSELPARDPSDWSIISPWGEQPNQAFTLSTQTHADMNTWAHTNTWTQALHAQVQTYT